MTWQKRSVLLFLGHGVEPSCAYAEKCVFKKVRERVITVHNHVRTTSFKYSAGYSTSAMMIMMRH